MCDGEEGHRHRPSKERLLGEQINQLIDSPEIKQEPGIKEEPQPVGELKEFPALDNRGDGQSNVDSSQLVCEDGPVNLSFDVVNIKIKEESGENIGKSSKSNGAKRSTKMNVQRGGTTQHQCQQCDYKTKRKFDLERHFLKHTGQTPFPCHRCGKAFKSKRNLQNHMKVHVNDFLFSCATCLEEFDEKDKKMHHEISCQSLRYECHLCKKSFGSAKFNLTKHMRVHSGERPFGCKECSKKFPQKSSLKRHMQLHAGPRSVRCLICRRTFPQEDEMIAHQQKCNRPVNECYVCGKSFGSLKGNLVRHMRTHTGDKPFKCTQCPKKFTAKASLNQHVKIHSQSLPWKCAICRQGFVKQTQWKSHQRNCRRRVYECFDCKKFLGPSSVHLKGHMTKHSVEKPFQCKCGNRFLLKSTLTRHLKLIHK